MTSSAARQRSRRAISMNTWAAALSGAVATSGAPIPIFGRGGAGREAQKLGVPLLGEVPLDIGLRQACDDGRPLVATAPESAAAQVFIEMAKKLL